MARILLPAAWDLILSEILKFNSRFLLGAFSRHEISDNISQSFGNRQLRTASTHLGCGQRAERQQTHGLVALEA